MLFLDENMDYCAQMPEVISVLKAVVGLLQFGVPILLILFGMIDLGKAVIASKEDEMKKAQGTLVKRAVYAVAVFLVVTLVSLVMGMVGSDNWVECWNGVGRANNVNKVDG